MILLAFFVDSRSKKLFTDELLEFGNAVSAAKLDCSSCRSSSFFSFSLSMGFDLPSFGLRTFIFLLPAVGRVRAMVATVVEVESGVYGFADQESYECMYRKHSPDMQC
jgi:hypothetical protein